MRANRAGASVLLVGLGILCLGLPEAHAICALTDDRVPDQVIVEVVPGASVEEVAARYDLAVLDTIPEYRMGQLLAQPGTDIDALVSVMSQDLEVQRAEPHRLLESPEGVQRSIGDLDATGNPDEFSSQPAAATIHTALAQSRYTGDGVVIAVLDTRFDLRNVETSARMIAPGIDVLGGGPTVDLRPDRIDNDGDGQLDEGFEHGNHVVGMIHLAAPGARILPIRVLDDDGKGQAFTIAKGILRAVAAGARVINISIAMSHDARAVERAIEDAHDRGATVVAAAGNRDFSCVEFPAAQPRVVAVAAVDNAKVKTTFSNYGPQIALSAPGFDLMSTWDFDRWGRWDGTSFAAPLVAGGAALLLEKYPGLSPYRVRDVLMSTTQPDANPPALSGLMGTGVLDLDRLTLATTTHRASLKMRSELGGTTARWSPVTSATTYDLARGDLAEIRWTASGIDLGPMTCIKNDSATTDSSDAADPDVPPPGRVYFYVFRDDAPDVGGGSYGADSHGNPRLPGAGDCPR